jgi:hypothetical protein
VLRRNKNDLPLWEYSIPFALNRAREMTVMKISKWFLSCFFIIFWVSTTYADQFKDGIHGMRWGSAITQHDHLTKVRDADLIAYYVNSNMLYQAANQAVPGVVYGFYQRELFAAYIKLQSPAQFQYTIQHFTAKLGEPKVTFLNSQRQSIYRWKDGDIKIKLKMNESIPDIKMGIYYMPLSDKVNQEQLEKPPDAVFDSSPSPGRQKVQTAPLISR